MKHSSVSINTDKKAPLDLFIFTGEASGDLHGARLIEELKKISPSLKIAAVAGPKMRAHGIQTLLPMEKFQVIGFVDVLIALPSMIKYLFQVEKFILEQNPKATILIDYPGFNLFLEKRLRKKGYKGKLIHYICPTVWAWKKGRIATLCQNLDLLITILPFEKECFKNTYLNVQYVGNPLVSQIPLKDSIRENIIAIFPGSREKEIKRNLPIQLEAVKKLLQQNHSFSCKISLSHPQFQNLVNSIVKKVQIPSVEIFASRDNYSIMQKAKLAIATSGTITLELALHGTPTVVTYAIKKWDLFIAQHIFKINLPFYALVNIIANKEVFPELFGPNLSTETLFSTANKLLNNAIEQKNCQANCRFIRKILGEQNASAASARLIFDTLESIIT